MENTLPFEYGYMYKPIDGLPQSEAEEVKRGVQIDTSGSTFYSNYGNMSGIISTYGIDESNFFHPIGYIASKQKIIAEVLVREEETTNGHMYMSGMSFQTTSLKKTYSKICRAQIDVNVFIRNFRKVL